MKLKTILLTLTTSALAVATTILLANNKDSISKVEATRSNPVSGVFHRVTSTGALTEGTKVIFVAETGEAMDDVWGNPGYVHGGTDGVTLSEDLNKVTLNNSFATVFTVEQGTETAKFDGVDTGSYAFRADEMSVCGQKKKNIYFAHNEKTYYGDNTFENIAYFKDRDIAVETNKQLESSWFVEFSVEQEDWYSEETFLATHIRNAKAVKAGDYSSEVRFTTSYAPRFCSNLGARVNLYYILDESLYSVSVSKKPTKLNYSAGDTIDLTGLEIEVHSGSGYQIISYSEDNADEFIYDSIAKGNGETLLNVSYQGWEFTITINVSSPNYSARKIGQLADYRGSYMLVNNSFDQALDVTNADGNSNPGGYKRTLAYSEYVDVATAKNLGEYQNLEAIITKDNNGYHIKNRNGSYLNLDDFSFTSSTTPVIVIEHGSNGEHIRSTSGKYLCYDSLEYEFVLATENEFDYSCSPVILCRYDLTSAEQTSLNAYISEFLDTTDVCDENGVSFNITQSNWNTLATDFNALSGTLQAEIINTTYNLGEEYTTDIQFAMSRYDYIYSKYHGSSYSYINDFIGRSDAGTLQNYFASRNYNLINVFNNDTAVIITIITSMSIVAVLFFYMLKKKKHQ